MFSGRMEIYLLFIVIGAVLGGRTEAINCFYAPQDCSTDDCVKKWECSGPNSKCGEEQGCLCLPCYEAPSCEQFVDKYIPEIRSSRDPVYIAADHTGFVYQTKTVDKDFSITCPKTSESLTKEGCHCGHVEYRLNILLPGGSTTFSIDSSTGTVLLEPNFSLEPAQTYLLEISATSGKLDENPVYAKMNLTVIVMSESINSEKDGEHGMHPLTKSEAPYSHLSHQDGHDATQFEDEVLEDLYKAQPLPANLTELSKLETDVVSRKKRSSSGTGAAAAKMSLTVDGTDPTDLLPGQSINYILQIILPTLSTAMDLTVEIFVMDAVSGLTPFAMCSAQIESIGASIATGDGTKLEPVAVPIEFKKNTELPTITDRVVFSFGSVKNTDADDSGTDKTASTIKITFSASLILNADYKNDTAIVSAGAEYDNENFVWVSRASYSFSMAPGQSYPSNIIIDGPDTAAEKSGATFTIDGSFTDPVGPFKFSVITPDSKYNLFTVSNIAIESVGDNMKCIGEIVPEYDYSYSVDRKTYFQGSATFPLVMSNLDYGDMNGNLKNAGNKVMMSFTVFFVDAKEGDIVSLVAGLHVGTTTLWTAMINVTITAEVAPASGTASYSVSQIGEKRTVSQYGTLTWGIEILVPGGSNALVECTVTPPADHKIAGVVWGNAGGNIALRPPLGGLVTYDDELGATAWNFNINSTGQITTGDAANTATLEISVQYLGTSASDVTVTCGGTGIILSGATFGDAGVIDMSGTAEPVNPDDTNWYLGSQQALIAKLKFPAGGTPYFSMVLETSGDFDVSDFGAEVCKVEIMSAGNGVPALAGPIMELNQLFELQKTSANSLLDDGAKLTASGVSGVDRGTLTSVGDDEVIIRMAYIIPKNQTTITSTQYNMSMGMMLNGDTIWTGWSGFTTDPGTPPAPSAGNEPLIVFTPPDDTTIVAGKPTLILGLLKTKPGVVDAVKLQVSVPSVATLSICRVIILAVGTSFPCVDKDPYGKELNPAQTTTIIHDTDEWGISADLDFGVIRNLGYGKAYNEPIADEDSIVIGVMVRGIAAGGPEDVTLNMIHGNGPTLATVSLTVVDNTTPVGTVLSADWVPQDGIAEAYADVMKIIDLVLTFPVDYNAPLKVTLENADKVNLRLCFAAVAAAGKNLPCVIPHMVVVTEDTADETKDVFVMDFLNTCHYPMVSDNVTEDTITIRFGVQFTKDGVAASATGTIKATVEENSVASAMQPTDYSVTLSSSAFDPSSLNISTTGFSVTLANNETEDVFPGSNMFYGVNIVLPPESTAKMEIGVMAPTDGGRAYATVHSFRWGITNGVNIGCLFDADSYDIQLLQNASLSNPMIHESQTDTMSIVVGFLTNTGLSYMQNNVKEPEDNTLSLEIEVLIADHDNISTNDVISISIAVKFGGVIYVVNKNLKIIRDVAADLIVLRSDVNFTDPTDMSAIFDSSSKKRISMTFHMSHVMNQSRSEANNAAARVLLPSEVKFVDGEDSHSCNITTYTFTNNHYLDFAITNLFFTDYLECNVSVTVDPDGKLPKGLGIMKAAALVRLVCSEYHDPSKLRYCGTTAVLPFEMNGLDCYDSLALETMETCQFSASTAINTGTAPSKAASGSAGGWSPAARSGTGWDHSITIDFLKKTRVTKIVFETVAAPYKGISQFKIQLSHNGVTFTSPCETVIDVTGSEVLLPTECRFQARYARIVIVDTTPDATPFGVRFQMFGCYLETTTDVCNALPTVYSDEGGWRQIGYDSSNLIFYFCDFDPKKKRSICFSTSDGMAWSALPAYVGSLIGEDTGSQIFYLQANDASSAMSSLDGVALSLVDSVVQAALTVTATSVPGNPSGSFTPATAGPYTADFTGIKKDGAYVVKWESCCS